MEDAQNKQPLDSSGKKIPPKLISSCVANKRWGIHNPVSGVQKNGLMDPLAVLSTKRYDRKRNCVLIPNNINLDTMPTIFRQETMTPN